MNELIKKVAQWHHDRNLIEAVIPTDDVTVDLARKVGEMLALPINSEIAVKVSTNKLAFREFCQDHDFRTPKFQLASADPDHEEVSFPCVAKPLTLSGSRGVIRCNNREELRAAVDRIGKAFENGERIMIYGDYDVDGTSSVALVCKYLRSNSTNQISTYIPDRYDEGYGISYQSIDYAADNEFSLVIALDCGIKAVDKISYANNKNIQFVILVGKNEIESDFLTVKDMNTGEQSNSNISDLINHLS